MTNMLKHLPTVANSCAQLGVFTGSLGVGRGS